MAGNWNRIGNISGRDGKGVPEGGAKDDVLVKVGGSDFATGWSKLDYSQIAGKVPAEALPQISVEPYVVDSQAKMLNLPAVPGRMAIRTDVGKTFVLAQTPASTLANWVELKTSSDVTSVNDKVGAVVLTKADVGLSNVDNTADVDKPLATDSVRGLMGPADRRTLYARSSKPITPILLSGQPATYSSVVYDAQGRFEVSEPTQNAHPASKGYVDGVVSRRGSSTGQLTQTTDLNTITDPGVYYVTRSSPNIPVIAGFRSACRVEVERLHGGALGGFTVFQTVRCNAWDTVHSDSTPPIAGADKNSLVSSMVFRRESHDSGANWTPWQVSGTSPWFTGGLTVNHSSVSNASPAPSWRVNAGNIEWCGAWFVSGTINGLLRDFAKLHTLVAPPIEYGMAWADARANTAVWSTIELSVSGNFTLHSEGSSGTRRRLDSLSYPAKISAHGGD